MGLLDKLRNRGYSKGVPQSTQFHESDTTAEPEGSRNAPRRELVHVILRDTMRKHGIPSAWIDCKVLSVMTRNQTPGLHAQFVVLDGEDRLMDYIHAFQDSFWEEIERFDPQVRQWLLSVSWQFEGRSTHGFASIPGPGSWTEDVPTQPPEVSPEELQAQELESDLKALYAIRDAAMAPDPTAPAPGPAPGTGRPR